MTIYYPLRFVCLLTAAFILAMTALITFARGNADDEPYFLTFNSTRDNGYGLYRINPDGSGVAKLTDHLIYSQRVIWSPRNMVIAYFGGASSNNSELYRVRWDGSGDHALTDIAANGRVVSGAVWTPDGANLLIEDRQIAVTTTLTRLDAHAHLAPLGVDDGVAGQYSPDGQWIAYQSKRAENYDIYVARADGSDERVLVATPQDDGFPQWSPDGSRILFVRRFSAESNMLYDVKPDGSDMRKISFASFTFTYGAFYSPDGDWIIFTSGYDSAFDIYKTPSDGSDGTEVTRLTSQPHSDYDPAWSPDGRWIAFVSNRDGNPEIYKMRPDGSDQQRLTNDPASDKFPAWSPSYVRDWQPGIALLAGAVLAGLAFLRTDWRLSNRVRDGRP